MMGDEWRHENAPPDAHSRAQLVPEGGNLTALRKTLSPPAKGGNAAWLVLRSGKWRACAKGPLDPTQCSTADPPPRRAWRRHWRTRSQDAEHTKVRYWSCARSMHTLFFVAVQYSPPLRGRNMSRPAVTTSAGFTSARSSQHGVALSA